MKNIIYLLILTCAPGCRQHKSVKQTITKKLDQRWLDSVISKSDSAYSKPYKRTDFVTAFFYLNKKDSGVCQVMKDSANTVRQVMIAKNGVRSFYAQYYANGQLVAELPLDDSGQYNGISRSWYESGILQDSGLYRHGIKAGVWKSFDPRGQIIRTESFDQNGQPGN